MDECNSIKQEFNKTPNMSSQRSDSEKVSLIEKGNKNRY